MIFTFLDLVPLVPLVPLRPLLLNEKQLDTESSARRNLEPFARRASIFRNELGLQLEGPESPGEWRQFVIPSRAALGKRDRSKWRDRRSLYGSKLIDIRREDRRQVETRQDGHHRVMVPAAFRHMQ